VISVGINALSLGKELVGTGQYTYHLIRGLAKIDQTNNYLLIKNKAVDVGINENRNIQYVDLFLYGRFHRILLENTYLPYIIQQNRLDVFHSPIFTLPFYMPVPCVVTIHDLVIDKFPETIDFKRRLYLWAAIRHSIAKADRIIAVSECTKRDIVKRFNVSETKIDVIHEAAAPGFCQYKTSDSTLRICRQYRIDKPYILYVGTIEPRKNLTALIRAYARLKTSAAIKHELVIVGKKSWYYGKLFREISRESIQDDVIFTGYLPRLYLPHFYNAADLFILPSLYEGFGLPILEAMACGTPVIASNVSALPEVAGDAAILIDPYDVEAIAEAMYRVLTDGDLRAELVKRGLERVKQFSWERCARETLRVYEKALSC